MTVSVRRATGDDLALLVRLESQLFPGEPWSEAALRGHLSAEHTGTFLLTLDGAPGGYLLAGFSPPEGELYRIAVAKEFRRRGYGRLLLDAFLSDAGARGAESLYLEVRESNAAAVALYLSAGFRPIARRENYYRNPCEAALILTRNRPKESV